MIPAATLADAWERGASLPVPDRAASLLGEVDPTCDVGAMSVGQCDALLFELRRGLFGDDLDAVGCCPNCADQVNLHLDLASLQPPIADPPGEVQVRTGGYRLSCRSPRNADLSALSRLGADVALQDIVGRCLIQPTSDDGSPVTADELPEDVALAVVEAMAEADPASHVLLNISCPCGATWIDQLDVRTVLWTEIGAWVGELLQDVHRLAIAYRWSERDIFDLSPWRRAWYLQALGW